MEPAEILNSATQHPARRKPEARSRVGNGKVLLPMTDGRSLTARRFQDLYEDVANDLGGLDILSEGQKQLIRRAAMLSAESERQEAEWANGRPFDLTAYSTTANCLRRIFESLGLKRVARPVNGDDELLRHFSRPPPNAEAAE